MSDINTFKNELIDAGVDPQGAVKPHIGRFLNVCIGYHVIREQQKQSR